MALAKTQYLSRIVITFAADGSVVNGLAIRTRTISEDGVDLITGDIKPVQFTPPANAVTALKNAAADAAAAAAAQGK